jgi:folate-dependent phosphoribosylglycinamide formyltransferase PurN
MSKAKLVIVTNGNYFARLIIMPTCLDSRWEIAGIVIVSGDYYGKSKLKAFFNLSKKTAFPYLGYKVFSVLLFELMDFLYKGEFKVLTFAKRLRIPTIVTRRINDSNIITWISHLHPDLLVSVSCPQRINKELLSIPKVAAINIHSSLLPSYAGLAPYFWVLAMGENQTGTTVHYMTERFDEGNILCQEKVDILPNESAFSLFTRLALVGAKVLPQGIERALKGDPGISQDHSRYSYFSHPTWEAYIKMKRNGHSLITLRDLLKLRVMGKT